jgi:hypothetical protein
MPSLGILKNYCKRAINVGTKQGIKTAADANKVPRDTFKKNHRMTFSDCFHCNKLFAQYVLTEVCFEFVKQAFCALVLFTMSLLCMEKLVH